MPILLYLTCIAASISIATQQVLNANLRAQIGSPWWAGVTSFTVGTIAMLAIALTIDGIRPVGAMFGKIQGFTWIGGLLGAIYVTAAILMVPRLGAASTVALVIVGQLMGAVVIDHFGLLGVTQHPISLFRLLGIALLIGGVVLVRL